MTRKRKIITITLGSILLCAIAAIILLITNIYLLSESMDYKPRKCPNSAWLATNPNIDFEVQHGNCFGEYRTKEKTINIKVLFDPGMGNGISIEDYDAQKKNNFKYNPNTRILRGECKFYKTKCIVTVTKSNVNNIKVGDKITFVKQKT